MEDFLEIDGKKILNRLFVGTGKFPNKKIIKNVLAAGGSDVVTVALRRVDPLSREENILDNIPENCSIMINTSGARNSEEAVRIARMGKASGYSNWIKIEVIPDNKYLLPDNHETLKTTEILTKEGFVCFPYMNPDLNAAKRLESAGATAVMPLGSPIGTNRGFKTKEIVRIMIQEMDVPVIVDAGIGVPSDAAACMEMGCAAVLVNTAIATAIDPVKMAEAFSMAVKAGRTAYLSGNNSMSFTANASSPLTGFLHDE